MRNKKAIILSILTIILVLIGITLWSKYYHVKETKQLVTAISIYGTPQTQSKTVVKGENVIFQINPDKDYVFKSITGSGCTYSNNIVTINNVQENITCIINFKLPSNKTMAEKILEDNPNPKVRTNFNVTFGTKENEKGLYVENREDYTQDGKPVYYFSGSTQNNYLKFANKIWRIVRINEDDSIRMIYAGTVSDITANGIVTNRSFNEKYDKSYYVGYMYTENKQHGNTTDSTIKKELNNWYDTNIGINYNSYVSKTAIYCNNRNVLQKNTWTANKDDFNYETLNSDNFIPIPKFKCNTLEDQFTGTNIANIGNQKLGTKPIALLTADEVVYAGGKLGTENFNYYLYDNVNYLWWWLMSPFAWRDTYGSAFEFYVGTDGGLYFGGVYVNYFGVRPVLSLKSCVLYKSGNGTKDNPYIVSIDNKCKTSDI